MTWLPAEGIPSLLNKNDNLVGLEIGTDYGVSTVYLLDSLPNLTLHGIDPYINYTDWCGDVNERDVAYPKFIQTVERFGERYVHHKKTSDDALNDFEDGMFDFIFIDGDHSYAQVLKDCQNYYSKLKKGGIFSGHDFRVIQDVFNAVNYFAKSINVQNINMTQQDVWYWIKE